ncbi:hypothetical protein SAMN05660816_05065, partial [Niastella yeongjuensis]
MQFSKYILALCCLGITGVGLAQNPFTAGNIVVYRIGDGSAPLNATAAKVFLDEYT